MASRNASVVGIRSLTVAARIRTPYGAGRSVSPALQVGPGWRRLLDSIEDLLDIPDVVAQPRDRVRALVVAVPAVLGSVAIFDHADQRLRPEVPSPVQADRRRNEGQLGAGQWGYGSSRSQCRDRNRMELQSFHEQELLRHDERGRHSRRGPSVHRPTNCARQDSNLRPPV